MKYLMIFTMLSACLLMNAQTVSAANAGQADKPDPNVFESFGNIVYVPVEGGFYGIVDDAGAKYNPRNLPEVFQQEGLRVRIKAKLLGGMMGFHMWGRYIDIISIVPTNCLAQDEIITDNCIL
ncbi:MAG: hypothetical protein GY862_16855 [Gammaproteobacteria bacterium]|nr:hypothetical protein [Gammaproteobacteria bacterium]